jgi:hypothetical protein
MTQQAIHELNGHIAFVVSGRHTLCKMSYVHNRPLGVFELQTILYLHVIVSLVLMRLSADLNTTVYLIANPPAGINASRTFIDALVQLPPTCHPYYYTKHPSSKVQHTLQPYRCYTIIPTVTHARTPITCTAFSSHAPPVFSSQPPSIPGGCKQSGHLSATLQARLHYCRRVK